MAGFEQPWAYYAVLIILKEPQDRAIAANIRCAMVFVWKLMLKPLGGSEYMSYCLHHFMYCDCNCPLLSEEPSQEIQKEFELAKTTSN